MYLGGIFSIDLEKPLEAPSVMITTVMQVRKMKAMITAETWIRGSAEAASIIGMNAKSGKMLTVSIDFEDNAEDSGFSDFSKYPLNMK